MKFYIASSFQNIDSVKYVSEVLKNKGYIHTYDWTKNERVSTIEKLQAIGQEEKNGVLTADILVVLLPAGKGSHIEFGLALGQGKKVFLYSPNDDVRDLETTSTFYHLPEVEIVIGTIDELIDVIFSSNV
ncbi:nucleoside 2-deoxyribosyltransferase [Psychrobacillus sp. PGGUH221]|uniref:nucleoside 2-deoxyribosyltransferase n=1 Tax=Psychrobacillus sp. PGGUH221 TaxID=3020058 RepID=UPI0035C709A8